MSYERMLAEQKKIVSQIERLEQEIANLPEGELLCSQNGKYKKWFWKWGNERKYIPKKNHYLVEQLARKKYLVLQVKDLIHEKDAIQLYLNHRDSYPKQADKLLLEDSKYQEMITPQRKSLEKEFLVWQESPYEFNEKYPEQRIHKTINGQFVRSKSEALIVMMLYKQGIPFRYECALQLGNRVIYPDFTIRHPKTGKVFYWEHFGMMDDLNYCQKACAKMQLYSVNGIIPSINLITTFETKEHPLDAEQVENMVEQYFLE